MTAGDDRRSIEALNSRLRTLLPEEYQDSYEDLQPVAMRSAGLKYGADGKVAWNEIWGSFCDLAMAGGPPHKGSLLESGTRADIDAEPARYDEVATEICRGVMMATGLPARQSENAGRVRVTCLSRGMAEWLLRAVVMENVAAWADGTALDLPASPRFRLEKEIKNVVTVAAKTCHYWMAHIPHSQQRAIATLLETVTEASPLIVPVPAPDDALAARIAETIHRDTGLRRSDHNCTGWLGVECPSVRAAVWMMRAIVVSNVLSRREGTSLFVPVNGERDPHGEIASSAVAYAYRLAGAAGIL